MTLFKYLNLAMAAVVVLGSLALMSTLSSPGLTSGLFGLVLGGATAALEFRRPPPQVGRYASFLLSFGGRGVFYIFIGLSLLATSFFRFLLGAVLLLAGVGYVSLEFSSVSPPDSLRFDPEVPVDTI